MLATILEYCFFSQTHTMFVFPPQEPTKRPRDGLTDDTKRHPNLEAPRKTEETTQDKADLITERGGKARGIRPCYRGRCQNPSTLRK
jgi:hypothetical protein